MTNRLSPPTRVLRALGLAAVVLLAPACESTSDAPRRRRPTAPAPSRSADGPSREEMAEVRAAIGEAIESGEITKAEGRARWDAYVKATGATADSRRRGRDIEEDALRQRIDDAVAEGRLTREQGDARLAAWRHQTELRRRLGRAVDAGEISREEAKVQYEQQMEAYEAELRDQR